MDLKEKEKIEIEFWKNSQFENPDSFSLANFLNKVPHFKILNTKLNNHHKHLAKAANILELGAGQGWASAFMKRWIVPDALITATDISPYALESVKYWEELFDIRIEGTRPCKSYELAFEDNQFDLVFCYAAAHHFVKYEETLAEIHRVLKPSGKCLFLYEPTCSKLFYKMHFKYVNRQRPDIPEDVLIPKEIIKLGEGLNFEVEHYYDHKSQESNSIAMSLYFKFISTFSFLQRVLPSSSDFIFTKRA